MGSKVCLDLRFDKIYVNHLSILISGMYLIKNISICAM